jgi:hypothetical protein
VDLEPIEAHLRSHDVGDDTVLLIRGGPLTAEKLVEHAARQAREFSLRGSPMASISVDGLVAGWTLELVLRERMWSRSQFATATAGAVRHGGFEVLSTHDAPHFDIVLAEATTAEAGRLLMVFGPPEDNPFKKRGRR